MQQFPRGFIWCSEPISPPDGYIAGPYENLFICKDISIIQAADAHRSVVILGLCVGIEPHVTDPAHWLLNALARDTFYEALDLLCGRFVIFVKDPGGLRVLSDATGMRAVFYRSDFRVIASHARLVSDGPVCNLPFRYGFPGNRTPFF